jgi:retron-type reverse transcriptase
MKTYKNLFSSIVSFENLVSAYKTFRRGKLFRNDVLAFDYRYEYELLDLERELLEKTYFPAKPKRFIIHEPKKRQIVAAQVRDRIVHHALCRVIEPVFEKRLIFDTYACRTGKGTLAAIERFEQFKHRLLAHFKEQEIYILKADIAKYFDNIDHNVLLGLIQERVLDGDVHWLIRRILSGGLSLEWDEYSGSLDKKTARGIPIGNLTSQFFANLYLNPLDQYIKHNLRFEYYIRYMDDFVIIDTSKQRLREAKEQIARFLQDTLRLQLHPKKQTITSLKYGIDFLGFKIFSGFRRLRKENIKRFKRRLKRLKKQLDSGSVDYLGIRRSIKAWISHAKHGNTYQLRKKILGKVLFHA